jgi:hypothetical protein
VCRRAELSAIRTSGNCASSGVGVIGEMPFITLASLTSWLRKNQLTGAHTVELLVQSRIWIVVKAHCTGLAGDFTGEYQVWAESGCG